MRKSVFQEVEEDGSSSKESVKSNDPGIKIKKMLDTDSESSEMNRDDNVNDVDLMSDLGSAN
jgi:hypothetical protein